MGDLHRFKDQTKTKEDRAKPVPAQKLDENFTVCRLKVGKDSEKKLQINDKFPNADEIEMIGGGLSFNEAGDLVDGQETEKDSVGEPYAKRVLDVQHAGAHGKRDFICGPSRAA